MSKEYLKQNLENLIKEPSAVEFCLLIYDIAQLFDDVYDSSITKEETYKLIQLTLIELPNNHFYLAFKGKLQPLLESLFLQWQAANKLEAIQKQLEKAYMLRAYLYQLYQYCAYLLHGNDYANENAALFQALYGENFDEYKKEILCQIQ